MQTFTLGLGSWLRRLAARHPLVRASDRIEAVAGLIVVVVALLAVPVAGAVGTAVHDSLVHSFAADRISKHEVAATVTHGSSLDPQPYDKPFLTQIHWQFGGRIITDDIRTADKMKVGQQQTIWIDAAGNRTAKPGSDRNAATEAVIVAVGLWLAVAGTGVGAWAVLRMRLDRSRYADWDRELDDLADNGGRTNHNT